MTRREIADVFKSVLGKGGGVQIDEIIELGVIPRFVEFLQCHDDPILQIEASMILNSIVTSEKSEHTEAVVEAGALPHLVQLLRSTNETANLQAAWVLNNIASESVVYRDRVVVEQGLSALLSSMQDIPFPEAGQLALKTQLSALLSFCGDRLGDRSKLPADVISPALKVLRTILECFDPKADDEVLCMVCSVISCISKDGEDDSIGQIVEAELCPLLVELLRHRNPRVQAASVRALGNLVSGDDERHTQAVLDCAVLPQLLLVLENQNHMWETRSDICWMLSNIAVGSLEQIEQLIESELIPTLVALLEEQNDHIDVRTEAAWVVSNSAASGSRAQIKYLVSQRCIHVLCNLLVLSEDSDLEMVNGVLHALENILEAGAAEAAQQMAMLRDEVESAMEKAEVLTASTDGQLELPSMTGADFEPLAVKEGLTALTEQEEIARMFPIATTLLNGKSKLKGAPAAASALEHVQNPYAVLLEQVGGVGHISQFLTLSEEYTVVESARRILENHFGMKSSAAEVCLHLAAQEGNVEAATKLILHGADVDAPDNTGRTSLIIAASLGHLELVVALVEAGADICAADTSSATPIKLSANGGFKEVARYLIQALKLREEKKKVQTEHERKQKEESRKQERQQVIDSISQCLQSHLGDWQQLQEVLGKAKGANIGTGEAIVACASRLVSCRSMLVTGLAERDRSRLMTGVEDSKRILNSVLEDSVLDGWLGDLCKQAAVMLKWLQEEKDAVGELKLSINQRNAAGLRAAITGAEALLESLKSQGEEAQLLHEEVASAQKVHERFLKEEEASAQLAEALQATPVQWSQLEAAIRNAERFGLRSQVQEGRQVLKNLISEARQQLQKGIKQRSAAELHATIEQVQKLGIESLSGELEKARNIANTIDKEANLVKEFTVSSAALQKDEAMLLSQEEWDKAVQQLDSWIEEMRSMNMRDQTRTAKTALNGLKPQHQLHKMLTSALQLPAELSAAIDKTRPHSKSLVPVNRVLLEKANELLATNLDEFGARLELLGASEDSGAVESFIEELKSAGMYKGLMARPGVRETLNNAKKAAESLTRKQMALNEEVAASAKKALAERVEREKAEKAEKSSPKASPILSARQPAVAAGEKAAEGSASVLAASPTETGHLDTRLSPSTEGATKQKNVPAKRRRAVGAATSPTTASDSKPATLTPIATAPSAAGESIMARGMLGGLISAGDGIGHELSSSNSIGSSTNNTSGASSSTSEPSLDSNEGTITVSWHETPGSGAASRPAPIKSDLAPKMSYASIAQVDKPPDPTPPSQPVTRSRLPALQDPQPSDTSGQTMQPLYRGLDVATPSSWVEACAAARAEAETRQSDNKQCSDSPSEDAFIQSIFRELDLDDDIE